MDIKYIILLSLVFIAACTVRDPGVDDAKAKAREFVENSPTFKYDGSELNFVETKTLRCDGCWQFIFEFTSSHGGYGDRTDEFVTQVITPHTAVVTVEQGEITYAVMDDRWNMKTQQPIQSNDCNLPEPTTTGGCEILRGYYYDSAGDECKAIGGCEVQGTIPFSPQERDKCIDLCVQGSHEEGTACAQDVKECPDGSYVSRNPDEGCKFYDCPSQDEVSWQEATETLKRGEADIVARLHSREIQITLKDGSQITTIEPEGEDIFSFLQNCDTCGSPTIAME